MFLGRTISLRSFLATAFLFGGFYLLSAQLSGCTTIIFKNYNKMSARAALALEQYDNPELLGQALPSNLITSEGYLGIEANNIALLVSTAKNYGLYAMGFVEDVDREHAKKLYSRGKELGLRALRLNPEFEKALVEDTLEEFNRAVKSFQKSDVEALYVTMSNWLSWVSLNAGSPEAMMDLPKVESLMFRILELNETYYHGAIHAALGAYYGSAAKAMGGQPEKAKQHFDKAFKISKNNFLYFRFLYAKTYLVQIQDKKRFVEVLRRLSAATTSEVPEMRMANEIAKIKAKNLLDKVDEYFL